MDMCGHVLEFIRQVIFYFSIFINNNSQSSIIIHNTKQIIHYHPPLINRYSQVPCELIKDLFFQVANLILKLHVGFYEPLNFLARVHHGSVVLAAKLSADLRK